MNTKQAGLFKPPPRMAKGIFSLFKRALSLRIQTYIFLKIQQIQKTSTEYSHAKGNLDILRKILKQKIVQHKNKGSEETRLLDLLVALKGIQELSGFALKASHLGRPVPRTVKRDFVFDTQGWEYAHLVNEDKLEFLKDFSVEINLYPDKGDGAASWNGGDFILELNPFQQYDIEDFVQGTNGIRNFKEAIKFYIETLDHELQHYAQQVLSEKPFEFQTFYDGSSSNKGLPKQEDSTPEYQQNKGGRANYYLDNAEFFPLLSSSIQMLIRNLDKLPKNRHKELIKNTVSGAVMDKALVAFYKLKFFPSEDYRMGPFYYYLKEYAPGRYRKAVKETISALGREGYL